MDKRSFLKALFTAGGVSLVSRPAFNPPQKTISAFPPSADERTIIRIIPEEFPDNEQLIEKMVSSTSEIDRMPEKEVENYLSKIRNFDKDFVGDIFLEEAKHAILDSAVTRLEHVQFFIGHGNFNLLDLDELYFFAKNYKDIGAFTTDEQNLIDEIFHFDATQYGFFGDKVIPQMTHNINMNDVLRNTDSGQYLYRGEPLELFNQMYKDVGSSLLLTSGVRNIVKQTYLFLSKAQESQGNLSRASRSIAPPGYSFHGIGDFDVGKNGLGERNFTAQFSYTEEFQHMMKLGYVDIRYTSTNNLGVRYEPWHIKTG